jgi:hypothetical protein
MPSNGAAHPMSLTLPKDCVKCIGCNAITELGINYESDFGYLLES